MKLQIVSFLIILIQGNSLFNAQKEVQRNVLGAGQEAVYLPEDSSIWNPQWIETNGGACAWFYWKAPKS